MRRDAPLVSSDVIPALETPGLEGNDAGSAGGDAAVPLGGRFVRESQQNTDTNRGVSGRRNRDEN
jgi:hypothetical protein